MFELLVPLACIVAAAILLAIASRTSGPPPTPKRSNLAETTDSPTGPREAVAPVDRRGRHP